jgi:hypothetical protein
MSDIFRVHSVGLNTPLIAAFPVTPSDTEDLPNDTRQLRVTGAGGNLAAIWANGQTHTIPVFTGDILDWRISRVLASGTTVSGLWGFY